jgi:omega-amidase
MSNLTITLVQMDCRLGEPELNFQRAGELIAEASRRGSQLAILPELWSTGYDLEHAEQHASTLAENGDGEGWFGCFARLARQHGLWLTGSLLESRNGRFFNCMPVYSPQGDLVAVYRKIHLFRLMQEEQFLASGDETTLLDAPWGRAGLAICYDLRFPEIFRGYALAGACLLILPAEWPHPRREHWRILLRARAIENQCYVAACNRVGSSKGSDFFGASTVLDPWGEPLIEGGEVESLLTVSVDLAQVEVVRQRIPVFTDRRPGLYPHET